MQLWFDRNGFGPRVDRWVLLLSNPSPFSPPQTPAPSHSGHLRSYNAAPHGYLSRVAVDWGHQFVSYSRRIKIKMLRSTTRIFILLVSSELASTQGLVDLLKTRIENAQCNILCKGLVSPGEVSGCQHTCRLPENDRHFACGLENCDAGCQAACASTTATRSTLNWFRRDGCRVSWGTDSPRRRHSHSNQHQRSRHTMHFILVGQDAWGKFNLLRAGNNINTFLFKSPNAGKWTRLVLFLVGKAGLEDRAVLPLGLPLDCHSEKPAATDLLSQTQQDPEQYYFTIFVIAVACMLLAAVVIIVVVVYQCRISQPGSQHEKVIGKKLFESASLSRSETYISYQIQDYKVYEDFSFVNYNSHISVVWMVQ